MIAVPLLIVIIIVASAFYMMKKQGAPLQEGEVEDLVKVFYYYLVLFVTLMMVIGGSIGVFMSVADYLFPQSFVQPFTDYAAKDTNPSVQPSPEEQKKIYEEMVTADKTRIQNNARNGMIKSLGWIIIPLPIFLYFQRRIRKKE
ncbi:hypothetical protein [Ectobacillus polymachus]|uniref:hypothetical protein n=1 Tax=Ectobacillus polymachus TaxID=1508806 RepID=UPI003A874249